MSEASRTPEVEKLRDMILSERDKGNVVFQALPGEFAIAPIDEFVGQPADEILYDLNRSEVISLTFLKDPKWVNDFAVALVIRKLKEKADERDAALERERVLGKALEALYAIYTPETEYGVRVLNEAKAALAAKGGK